MSNMQEEPMSSRRFVALVRTKLNQMGHADLAVRREWIVENMDDHPFLLNVPVGPELRVALKPMSGFFDVPAVDLDRQIDNFAKALVNLRRAEKMLTRYVASVRRAAVQAISAAREDGVDIQLDGIQLKPVYAWHLSVSSWKEAAYHILAEVRIRQTSFYLQPEIRSIYVEEPEHVAEEVADLLKEARQRQRRLMDLETLGADLEVDAITLDILEAHQLPIKETLREAWRQQCLNLKVLHLGRETSLSLVTSDGRVTASLALEEAYWNGREMWFTGVAQDACHDDLIGRRLEGLVSHPALASREVVGTDRNGRLLKLDLSDKLLFDADTGRVWRSGCPLAKAA